MGFTGRCQYANIYQSPPLPYTEYLFVHEPDRELAGMGVDSVAWQPGKKVSWMTGTRKNNCKSILLSKVLKCLQINSMVW